MDDKEWLAERFEEHRPQLRPGGLLDARLARRRRRRRPGRLGAPSTAGAENLAGWLTAIVARVCLNTLRSRNTRREDPVGIFAPDLIVTAVGAPLPEDDPRCHNRRPKSPARRNPAAKAHPALVNAATGVVITRHRRPAPVTAFTICCNKIIEIDSIGDPERVKRLAAAVLTDPNLSPTSRFAHGCHLARGSWLIESVRWPAW